jgi:hypothetical protein
MPRDIVERPRGTSDSIIRITGLLNYNSAFSVRNYQDRSYNPYQGYAICLDKTRNANQQI